MLSTTVNDLLLSYKNETIEKEFREHLSNTFDITTPDYNITELKFLSLTIYQSEHVTPIVQTQYIQDKILST